MLYVHAPACCTVKVSVATRTVPLRGPPVFPLVATRSVPVPDPLPPLTTVIHATSLDAGHSRRATTRSTCRPPRPLPGAGRGRGDGEGNRVGVAPPGTRRGREPVTA